MYNHQKWCNMIPPVARCWYFISFADRFIVTTPSLNIVLWKFETNSLDILQKTELLIHISSSTLCHSSHNFTIQFFFLFRALSDYRSDRVDYFPDNSDSKSSC